MLLDSGSVATSNDCCCGGGECSSNFITLTKCGFPEFEPFVSTPPKIYLTLVAFNQCNTDPVQQCTDTSTYDPLTCVQSDTCVDNTGFGCGGTCFPSLCPFIECSLLVPGTSSTHIECGGSLPTYETYRTQDLSSEYTTADLITNTLAAYTDTYGDCPDGCTLSYVVSDDELSCTAFCAPV